MRPRSSNNKKCPGHWHNGDVWKRVQCTNSECKMVAEYYPFTFCVTRHEGTKRVKILTRDENVIYSAQAGDYFRFMSNDAGGGGHSLSIQEFNVTIHNFSKVTMENWIYVTLQQCHENKYNPLLSTIPSIPYILDCIIFLYMYYIYICIIYYEILFS